MDPARSFLLSLKIPTQPQFRSLLPLFHLQLRACNNIWLSYFQWNESAEETCVHDSKLRQSISSFQRIALSTYTLILFAYFISPNSHAGTSKADNILGFVFITTFLETSLMSWIFYLKQKDVVLLWNSFLNFEKNYLPRMKFIFIIHYQKAVSIINILVIFGFFCSAPQKNVSVDILSRGLMVLGFLSNILLPGFMLMMLLVNPCKQPFLGYIFLKSPDAMGICDTAWSLKRVCILCIDTYMWIVAVVPGVLTVFQTFFLGLRCFDRYLHLIHR